MAVKVLERWRFQWISFVGQSAERLYIRGWKTSEILQTVFKFQTGWKRQHAIISFSAITAVDSLWEDLFLSCLFKCLCKFFWGGVKAYRLFFFPVCVLTHFLDYESLQTSKNIEKCYLMNTALDVYHLDLPDGM